LRFHMVSPVGGFHKNTCDGTLSELNSEGFAAPASCLIRRNDKIV
jgi:hypothetical protein